MNDSCQRPRETPRRDHSTEAGQLQEAIAGELDPGWGLSPPGVGSTQGPPTPAVRQLVGSRQPRKGPVRRENGSDFR
jgi:hypothetical protein